MNPTTRQVVILEDQPMMRAFLQSRLESRPEATSVVYSGASIADASHAIPNADVVILDLNLGDGSPPEANLASLQSFAVPVLVVSASVSTRNVQLALSSGVKGYVSKHSQPEEFDRAVDAVLTGQPYVSPDLGTKLAMASESGVKLSNQERRAMALYSSGMKLEQVADTMGIGVGTVKEYIRRVRGKYAATGEKLPTKVDLYRKAQEEGLF